MEIRYTLTMVGPFEPEQLEPFLDEAMGSLGYERVAKGGETVVAWVVQGSYWVGVPRAAARELAKRGAHAYEAQLENVFDDEHADGGTYHAALRVLRYLEKEAQLVVAHEEEIEGEGLLRGGAMADSAVDLVFDLIDEHENLPKKITTLPSRSFRYGMATRFASEAVDRAWRAIQQATAHTVDERPGQVRLKLELEGGARRILILKPEEWAELAPHLSA